MDANEISSSFAGYQKTARQIIAAASSEIHLTEEQTQQLLDAIDHSKSSYAEEALAENLHKLQEQFEEHERRNEADKREQAKENRVNRWMNVASLLLAAVSASCAVVALILQLLKV